MITQEQLDTVVGSTAYDKDGDKVGKIGGLYYDDATNEPSWLTVHTGLFGTKETFIPVQGVEVTGDRVILQYDKATVKDAPNVDEDGHLSPQEEEQLYRYYGVQYAGGVETGRYAGGAETRGVADTGRTFDRDSDVDRGDVRDTVGRDTSGPNTDSAMTRSEEQLRVGTETHEAGRARLRKHVVTEHQQVTVPVTREEVTLEREPITETNRGAAYDGPAISEEEHEVTLHAERPVVDTEAVAVERVRLGKETVTDQETVGGEVRKEEIELDRGDANLRDDVRGETRGNRS
jgi:uncharacterized protein (TIGR02271 family)